jgi:quinol monooxygenase YgiN
MYYLDVLTSGKSSLKLDFGISRVFRAVNWRSGRPLTDHHMVLIAGLRATPGCEKKVYQLLHRMAARTRLEPGCLTYDIHQSTGDSELFFVYQIWQDETTFEAHCRQDYTATFKNAAPDLLEGPIQLHKWKILA